MRDAEEGISILVFGAVFIYVIVTLGLSENITGLQVDRAIERCANNDGIRDIEFDYTSSYVICNNGGEFSIGKQFEVES